MGNSNQPSKSQVHNRLVLVWQGIQFYTSLETSPLRIADGLDEGRIEHFLGVTEAEEDEGGEEGQELSDQVAEQEGTTDEDPTTAMAPSNDGSRDDGGGDDDGDNGGGSGVIHKAFQVCT